ncbi:hypothetical protein D3C75_1009750 [compost metagenome]
MIAGARHLGGTGLQLEDGGRHLIGLSFLLLYPRHHLLADLRGLARLAHQVLRPGLDLHRERLGVVGQLVNGVRHLAELVSSRVAHPQRHVPLRH